jgi:FtsP/CotA-like multicopper oxidase with cupredoxin domain
MSTYLNRREFLKWLGVAGVVAANGQALVVLAQDAGGQHTVHPGYSYVVGAKEYPFQDAETGEWLFHEKIRDLPFASLKREPRTAPVNLLNHQPRWVESEDGVLEADLTVQFTNVVVNGQKVNLRTYNGGFPGPTLVVKPGDVLRLREVNTLPAEPATGPHQNINHPHGFNDLNLHVHGLNVSPEDSEDNVLVVVRPGETFEHEIHIPSDHPTGTYWYHPHKHGSTSCQVGSGMAGMLLVVDPGKDIRSIPGISDALEVILLFQEIYIQDRPDGVGEVPGMPISVEDFFYGDRIRYEQTVNGVACNEIGMDGTIVIPEIHMWPGEVQHWRMCHGGIFQNWLLGIEGHQMHIVAYDGVTLDTMETVDECLFVSGQRRDILVKASNTPGTYAVKRKTYKQAAEANSWPEKTLFNIVVEDGDPMDMPLPTRLKPPRARLPYITDDEIIRKRDVAFSFIDNTAKGIFLHTIDGKVFKPGRVDFTMVLDTAEEWVIHNNPASDHPFHIHVNWFELHKVIDGAGKETVYNPPIWMDCANIPANGSVVIRHRFENYQGKAVFHCHFLSHEDEGMMSIIEIVDGSPKTETITPAGGVFLSNDYEHQVQVRFLRGSVDTDTEVTYLYNSSPNSPTVNPAPELPTGMADYARFFSLTATQGGTAVATLKRPATFEIKYSSAQVDVPIAPSSVRLCRFDEEFGEWTSEGITMIAITPTLLTCSTKKLGRFGVIAPVAVCADFVEPVGVGLEDLKPLLENKDSPHAFFIAPYDIAPAGAPDGVLDAKDIQAVLDAQGQFCAQ